MYTIKGIDYPSVSQITGLLDKSEPMKKWAVNCMAEYIRQNAFSIDKNIKGCKFNYWELDEAILNNAILHYREVSKEALDVGKEVHDMIEKHIKGKKIDYEICAPQVRNAFNAFLTWEEKYIDKWLESEQIVWNSGPEPYYAGKLDAIAKMRKKVWHGIIMVWDFKSSKAHYPEYGMQASSYWAAREIVEIKPGKGEYNIHVKNETENEDHHVIINKLNGKIEGCGILRLDKETGMPDPKDYTKKHDRNLAAFFKLLEFFYAQKKRRLKNNPCVW